MKISVTQSIMGLDDVTPIPSPTKAGQPLTLREVLVQALLQLSPQENVSGAKKYKFFKMARRIEKNDDIDFKAEELTMFKECVGKAFFPLVVGPVWDLLDGRGVDSAPSSNDDPETE